MRTDLDTLNLRGISEETLSQYELATRACTYQRRSLGVKTLANAVQRILSCGGHPWICQGTVYHPLLLLTSSTRLRSLTLDVSSKDADGRIPFVVLNPDGSTWQPPYSMGHVRVGTNGTDLIGARTYGFRDGEVETLYTLGVDRCDHPGRADYSALIDLGPADCCIAECEIIGPETKKVVLAVLNSPDGCVLPSSMNTLILPLRGWRAPPRPGMRRRNAAPKAEVESEDELRGSGDIV